MRPGSPSSKTTPSPRCTTSAKTNTPSPAPSTTAKSPACFPACSPPSSISDSNATPSSTSLTSWKKPATPRTSKPTPTRGMRAAPPAKAAPIEGPIVVQTEAPFASRTASTAILSARLDLSAQSPRTPNSSPMPSLHSSPRAPPPIETATVIAAEAATAAIATSTPTALHAATVAQIETQSLTRIGTEIGTPTEVWNPRTPSLPTRPPPHRSPSSKPTPTPSSVKAHPVPTAAAAGADAADVAATVPPMPAAAVKQAHRRSPFRVQPILVPSRMPMPTLTPPSQTWTSTPPPRPLNLSSQRPSRRSTPPPPVRLAKTAAAGVTAIARTVARTVAQTVAQTVARHGARTVALSSSHRGRPVASPPPPASTR